MGRLTRILTLLALLGVALAPAWAPSLAEAAAGDRNSLGSRGSRTWMAPPSTATAPYAAPMQRSITPNTPAPYPGYANPSPGYAQPGYGQSSMPRRSSFMSGLFGGLIGAGIGGMLFGHGMFGGGGLGFGGLIGLLLQVALIVLVVRWVVGFFRRSQLAPADGPSIFARAADALPRAGMGGGAQPPGRAVTITQADYQAFEQILKDVQAGWSAQDLNSLRRLLTPEMVGYFGELLAEHASQGVRNVIKDVRLESGDLAEAWAEGGREYATVAMRFSMLDATVNGSGQVIDGSTTEHQSTTELWTFVRSPGGRWLLSAIQQSR